MKQILVPTDFSKYSSNATELALSIASRTGARVHFLHIIHLPWLKDKVLDDLLISNRSAFQDLIKGMEQKLTDLQNEAHLKGVDSTWKLEEGDIFKSVIEYTAKNNIDLVCIGQYGDHENNAIPAGALTQKLIRLAPCPVLIAKGGVNSFSPKKMLFTSSFFEENAEMLARVNEFARLFSSELHLLKVITPEKFEPTTYSKRAITEIAAKARITDYQLAIFNDYSVEEGVYRYATLESVDCICMCTHTKSGIFQLMHKSVAEEVLSGAHVPVLIFRLKENRVEEGVLFPD